MPHKHFVDPHTFERRPPTDGNLLWGGNALGPMNRIFTPLEAPTFNEKAPCNAHNGKANLDYFTYDFVRYGDGTGETGDSAADSTCVQVIIGDRQT